MSVLLSAMLLALQAGPSNVTELGVTGIYHDPSHLIEFPVQLEGWTRGRVLRYEVAPGGVSVSFRFAPHGGTLAYATAYVYPRTTAEPLNAHMNETVEELLDALPGAVLVSDEAAEFGHDDEVFGGRMATILQRAQGGTGPLIHYVILSDQGHWWLKWRITHPAADEAAPSAADRLVGSLLPQQRKR